MIGLLQRVSAASVKVGGQTIAEIGTGVLVLVGVQTHDTGAQAERLAQRILGWRLFADHEGRMNIDVRAALGAVLLVPQFTLAADTSKGNRAGFSRAAAPEIGRELFEALVAATRRGWPQVQTGQFGADMQVRLVNEGPVTFWLEVPPRQA